MWLARDKNGQLNLYERKPVRINNVGYFTEEMFLEIKDKNIPFGITWENSPIEVEIEIKRKEK